jgi:hypothetical protein
MATRLLNTKEFAKIFYTNFENNKQVITNEKFTIWKHFFKSPKNICFNFKNKVNPF